MSEQNNNTQAAIEAGLLLAKLQTIQPIFGGAPVAILPPGYKTEVINLDIIEKWFPKPARKKGFFPFADVSSFIAYFMEHKDLHSRIFASVSDTGGSFKGILNFHGKDSSFNDHICETKLVPTHEWELWMANNKEHMTQGEFALFLEENCNLFIEPKGADLLDVVNNLEGHANINVNSAQKLQTGAIKLMFDEDIELKGNVTNKSGDMTLPATFTVAIAPFHGVSPYAIKARLRYRVANRKITFFYETIDSHLIVREVCKQILDVIKEKTSLVPFLT